jgi:predicted acyl esterase
LTPTAPSEAGSLTYNGLSEGVTCLTEPLDADTEITGPIAAKLWVSSATADADLFVVLRVFSPDLREVTFAGAVDPHSPIAQGWLRASHRRLDPELTLPYRPYHSHDRVEPLNPGEVYELDVEIWPTCIVVPRGYRIGLSVRGRDYEWPGGLTKGLGTHDAVFTGVGPFKHNDPDDRPPAVFGGDVTLHVGPDCPAHVLLPVVPPA